MRRNHALWLGPVVTFAAAVSYFLVFARYPALRDFPWVNLPLALVGLAVSAIGLRRALAPPAMRRGRILGAAGFAASLLLAGAFAFYVFAVSYWLPAPSEIAASLATAPDFTLTDHAGRTVRLSDLRGRKVVLTFYRGFW